MLEEKNKATLKRAIRQLAGYGPEASVWVAISNSLDQLKREETLLESLHDLPDHVPPDAVWKGIATELTSSPGKQKAHIRPLYLRFPWAAAAAVALMLAGLSWLWLSDPNPARITVVRSEVKLSEPELVAGWNEDEAVFEEVRSRFAEHPLLRDQPQMRRLDQELEELNAAKATIEKVIDNYGRDADLIRQIGQIERERSNVLKRMVAMN